VQIDISILIAVVSVALSIGSVIYARAQARATLTQAQGALAALNWQGGASASRLNELWRELMESPILLEELLATNPALRPLYDKIGARHMLLLTEYFNLVHATWHLRKQGLVSDYRWPAFEAQARYMANAATVVELFELRANRGLMSADFAAAWRALRKGDGKFDPRGGKGGV